MFLKLLKDWQGEKAGTKIEMSETDAAVLIKGEVAEQLTNDPLEGLISKGVQTAIDAAVTQALQKFAQAQTLSQKNGAPILFGAQGGNTKGKSFGDFLLAVARKDVNYLAKHYDSHFNEWSTKAALAESGGATGGFTVAPDFYQNIMALVAELSFIRPRAFVQPMGSATLQIPYLDVTTVQAAGTSPFFSALKMNWTAEAQSRTETEPAFKQMELKAWELSGYSVSSNTLLQDSVIGLETFLYKLFSTAIAWYEEFAFLQGSGSGKPQGMLGCSAAIACGGAAGGASRLTASQIQFADVATMWSKLLPSSWNKAIWVGSPSTIPQILQLKDGANRAIFISIDSGITKAPSWNLMGRPFFPTEKVPALGTKGDLMLLDPSHYVIGDRQQIEIAASEHVNFLANQMTWRVVERVDGQPWMDKPVTLQDATTQVSPFVVLN